MQRTGVTDCTTYELTCSSCQGMSLGDKALIEAACSRCAEGTLQTTGRVLAYDSIADATTFIDPEMPPPRNVRRIECDWPGVWAFGHRYEPSER